MLIRSSTEERRWPLRHSRQSASTPPIPRPRTSGRSARACGGGGGGEYAKGGRLRSWNRALDGARPLLARDEEARRTAHQAVATGGGAGVVEGGSGASGASGARRARRRRARGLTTRANSPNSRSCSPTISTGLTAIARPAAMTGDHRPLHAPDLHAVPRPFTGQDHVDVPDSSDRSRCFRSKARPRVSFDGPALVRKSCHPSGGPRPEAGAAAPTRIAERVVVELVHRSEGRARGCAMPPKR